MANTGLRNLDRAVQLTNEWLVEAMEELHTDDRNHAYNVLKATLHALRDNLHPGEAADFASQLPLVLRGVYYEGWKPGSETRRAHSLDEFYHRIMRELTQHAADPERCAKVTFKLLERHIDAGQIAHVKTQLPEEIRRIWR